MALEKQFGVRITDEMNEKIEKMAGSNKREWLEKMIALAESQSVKDFAPEYSPDLKDVEIYTSRIFEAVSTIVQRAVMREEEAVKELSDKLEKKESIIGEFQEKAKSAVEELKQAQESIKALDQEKAELLKQLEESRSTHENNQLLVNQFKEKNDTLNGLVSKYQSYADENEKLKEQLSNERKQLESQMRKIRDKNDEQQDEIKELKQQVQSLKDQHAVELERLVEKKDFEKNNALLEVEREYQQKLLQSNEEYNARIKELFDEVNSIRKEYEDKIDKSQPQVQTRPQQKSSRQQNKK